jgi:hypothetical protein
VRLRAGRLRALGVLLVLGLCTPGPARAACGFIPGEFPVMAGNALDVGKDVIVNGNPVAGGASGAGSTLETDGSRGTASETLPDLDPPVFPANGSTTDATAADSPFTAGSEVFYDEITIGDGQSAVFSGGGPFHVATLTVGQGATLSLAAGTYYVDTLTLGKDAVLAVSSEPVLLHIGTTMSIDKDVVVNGGGSVIGLQVLLHTGASFDGGKDLDFTGIIYGPNAAGVTLDKDATFHGAIATSGEVDIGKGVEFTLTPADQVAIGTTTTCPSGPDHFSIVHDGSAVNCQAEPVTLTAHDASHAVQSDFTGSVTLSTSSGNGDWSLVTGAGALVNGGGGAGSYTFDAADAGQATLALKNTFVESVDIDVASGTTVEAAGEDPPLAFAATGFAFLADGASGAIATQVARKPSYTAPGAQALELQAITTSPATGACEAALIGAADVEVAYECVDPVACTASPAWFSGIAVAANPAGAVGAYTTISLDFGDAADTTAPFDLVYDDAGLIRLHARFAIPDGSGTPSINLMTGASNAFVVRPFGFDVDFAGDRAANGTAGISYAADAAGSPFVIAGESFDTTLTAVAWSGADDADADGLPDAGANLADNALTPAFGQEIMPASAALSHILVEPAGGSAGTLSGGPVAGFTGGVASATLAYDEVGIVDLTATSVDYLGSGASITGSAANLGRFYPARFSVADTGFAFRNGPDAGWGCGFTYMEQPFAFAADPYLTLTALNLAGAVTRNYGGDFFRLPAPYLAGRAYTSTAITTATLDAPAIGTVGPSGHNDLDGAADLTLVDELFAYTRPLLAAPPFDAEVTLTVPAGDLVDADGVCHDPVGARCNTGAGDPGEPYAVAPITGASLRFGRLAISNAAGSELLALVVPTAAQHFDGAGFITSADDACTVLPLAAIDLANAQQDPPLGDFDIAVGAGVSAATLATPTLVAGDAGLAFSSPGVGQTGYVDLRFDLSTAVGADLAWLRFDWDGDGSHDDDPSGRATFGVYQGAQVLIHIREPWN